MRHTKIVATLGPATDTPECMARLIRAGMNVARLNFSHGDHETHARRLASVRAVSDRLGIPVAVLQDLSGPKMRTGLLQGGQPVELTAGQRLTITTEDIVGDAERISTDYEALPQDVRPGDSILLSDGLIQLRVLDTTDTAVQCEVLNSGELRQRQGINLPGVDISSPTVTDKDIDDLRFGLAQGVDYVAMSFVRRAADILQIKDLIAQAGQDVPVIAKIERPEAVQALDSILAVADGIMVARGDLGVEMPLEQVTLIQKRLIRAANERAVPVITATQMLESMIRNPNPTRAEVSDVANAILDGSDAVMLSGETSIGKYPVKAVETMALIARAVEQSPQFRSDEESAAARLLMHEVQSVPEAIGAAVSAIANTLPVKAVWVFTQTGNTARMVAQYRPPVPILALTPYERICRRMALFWGVTPLKVHYFKDDREFWEQLMPFVVSQGYAQPGDTVVITGGHPFHRHGPTNFLKIQVVEAGPDAANTP